MGDYHSVALVGDGSISAWGSNGYGQCNVPVLPAGLVYIQVDAGKTFTVARRSDGSVMAWGENGNGQCNVSPLPPGLAYVEVAGGDWHTVARRSDGSVVAWGLNNWGQCNVPTLPAGLTYVEVDAGGQHSVARRSDGSIVAWGFNNFGQCHVLPLPAGLAYVEVAAGEWHTVARRSDGSVVAWGQGSPPSLPGGMTAAEVAAGWNRTAAVLEPPPACGSVSLYCWPAAANSVNAGGASFTVSGCPGLSANDLVFTVSGLPPGKAGIFYYGEQQAQVPFGNGWRCIVGSVQRVLPLLVADPTGVVSYPVDLSAPPFTGGAHPVTAGSAWSFQFWYRDPQGSPSTTNLSDAQHVVFAP